MLLRMSNVVEKGSECEVVDQFGRGCDAVKSGRDCEAVGQIEGRESEAACRAGLGLARI